MRFSVSSGQQRMSLRGVGCNLPYEIVFEVHLAKINALTRLLDFTGAARAIRTAVEQDQQKNIELLHSFLFCLADQTSKIRKSFRFFLFCEIDSVIKYQSFPVRHRSQTT